jgi:hypothetical protein
VDKFHIKNKCMLLDLERRGKHGGGGGEIYGSDVVDGVSHPSSTPEPLTPQPSLLFELGIWSSSAAT